VRRTEKDVGGGDGECPGATGQVRDRVSLTGGKDSRTVHADAGVMTERVVAEAGAKVLPADPKLRAVHSILLSCGRNAGSLVLLCDQFHSEPKESGCRSPAIKLSATSRRSSVKFWATASSLKKAIAGSVEPMQSDPKGMTTVHVARLLGINDLT
jgi:hypothetical protein